MKLLHLPHDVSGMLKKVFEKITRELFWSIHDLHTKNKQISDLGSHYSMIAFPNSATRNNSQKVKRKSYQKIVPISDFYEAKVYYQ